MTVCIKYCITLLLVSLLMAADEFVISLKMIHWSYVLLCTDSQSELTTVLF